MIHRERWTLVRWIYKRFKFLSSPCSFEHTARFKRKYLEIGIKRGDGLSSYSISFKNLDSISIFEINVVDVDDVGWRVK